MGWTSADDATSEQVLEVLKSYLEKREEEVKALQENVQRLEQIVAEQRNELELLGQHAMPDVLAERRLIAMGEGETEET